MTRKAMNATRLRAVRAGTSKAMKIRAERRRCPECKRGNAIVKRDVDLLFYVLKCRWCSYERGMGA